MIASCAWLADIGANICKDEDWGKHAFSASEGAFRLFSWPGKFIGIFLGFVPSIINGAVNAATRHTSKVSGENIAESIEQLNTMSDAQVNDVVAGIVNDYKEKRSWKQSDSSKKLIKDLEAGYNNKQDKITLISDYLKTASQNVGKTLYNIIINKIGGAPSTDKLQKSTLKNKL